MWEKQYQTPNLPELHGIVIIHYSVLTLHKENWNSFTEIEAEGGRGPLNSDHEWLAVLWDGTCQNNVEFKHLEQTGT